jgi:hypothetical protein
VEIASLAGLSIPTARKVLEELLPKKHAERHADKLNSPYTYWELSRSGLSLARRSLNLPPGARFAHSTERGRSKRERAKDKDRKVREEILKNRHQRTARLWPAWLRKAYPEADIRAGWSEVMIPGLGAAPDGLAWGDYGGRETLFWLEVESGHTKRAVLVPQTQRRLARAVAYADQFALGLRDTGHALGGTGR